MTRPPRSLLRARLIGMAALALPALLLAPATSASAAEGEVTVVINPATQTVEYGQYWEVTATVALPECFDCDSQSFDMIVESPDNGQLIDTKVFDGDVFISSFDMSLLLPPDTYEVRGRMTDDSYTNSSSSTMGAIVVQPAALAVEATVIPDEHQSEGAIVSAQLTGAFVDAVDECFGSTECHIPLPSGTWTLSVKDSEGTVIREEEIATKGAASRYASFYLHGIAPSTSYTVDASFAPTSSQADFYTVSAASGVAFESGEAPAAGDPDAPAVPTVEVEVATGPTLPLWLVILGGVIVGGLAVAAGVFWLLLLRRRQAGASETSFDAPIAGGTQ
jgi:hypothetical protein